MHTVSEMPHRLCVQLWSSLVYCHPLVFSLLEQQRIFHIPLKLAFWQLMQPAQLPFQRIPFFVFSCVSSMFIFQNCSFSFQSSVLILALDARDLVLDARDLVLDARDLVLDARDDSLDPRDESQEDVEVGRGGG